MPDHNYFSNLIWQIADLFQVRRGTSANLARARACN